MHKNARIKKNSEYRHVFQNGKSVATRALVLYVLPNGQNVNRIGYVASKKIGNAVTRNRVKRLLKEAAHQHWQELCIGFDLVVIARPPIVTFDYAQTATEMKMIFRRGGLLKL